MRRIATAVLILGACWGANGQSSHPPRTFEVASIRRHLDPPHSINISTAGARLNVEATMAFGLILYAYDMKNYQVERTPPLLAMGDDMYDIVATAEAGGVPSNAEFREMMRTLLADRFKLQVRHETKGMPVYALIIDKNGTKFKKSPPDASEMGRMMVEGRNNVCTYPKITMDRLAQQLGNAFLDRPIVDDTGLTGTYEIKLTYTPEFKLNRGDPEPSDIRLFTALQDQLGLKLVAKRANVEMLVVDHMEKPTPN